MPIKNSTFHYDIRWNHSRAEIVDNSVRWTAEVDLEG